MSVELMLVFLTKRYHHWSDSFVESLRRNPSKLTAIYMKEIAKKDIQKRVAVSEPLFPTAPSFTQDYLDFLDSREHQDWCLIED